MRRSIIAGNWKMNGTRSSIKTLITELRSGCSKLTHVEFIVFPPTIYLPLVVEKLAGSSIAWGGQDLSDKSNGAYTGDISAEMLLDYGCRYVLVGHSERRQIHDESNELIAAKTKRALEAGLHPIVCFGESLKEREADQTLSVIQKQLEPVLALREQPNFSNISYAYEPVWAIGTGKSAKPEQAQKVHAAVRDQLRGLNETLANQTRILYGGSVKPENAADLFVMTDIDGALVGGASLHADKFLQIGKLCNN